MKAMVYDRFGGPEVLREVTLPLPKYAQNSLLVRVKAAGVNPADIALQAGAANGFMDTWFPAIPGWDAAGVVEAVGAGVSEFAPGDEVLGYLHADIVHAGTYAEYVAGPAERFVRKPEGIGWAEAAALPLAGLTALQAVRRLTVPTGSTVLVLGASGGVGALAAQCARNAGLAVAGAASPAHHARLRGLGIVPVRYGDALRSDLAESSLGPIAAIIDCAGSGALRACSFIDAAVARVSIADGGAGVTTVFACHSRDDLQLLAAAAAAGRLALHVAAEFPLTEAGRAQALAASRHAGGKLVLLP